MNGSSNSALDAPPPGATPPPLPGPATFSPLAESQRHDLIDALRGLAILGIFLVNIVGMKSPVLAHEVSGGQLFDDSGNGITLLAIEVFASGKFVTMFALLFGVGMAMQSKRSAAAGRPFNKFFLRRMAVLLVIGVAHGILLWAGDVLAIYAMFGMAGLLFIRLQAKTLILIAGILFGLLTLLFMLYGALGSLGDETDVVWSEELGEWWITTYQTGSFSEIVVARLSEWKLMWVIGLISYIPYAFTLFLTGLALGKMDFLARLEIWHSPLRRWVAICGIAGLVATLVGVAVGHQMIPSNMVFNILGMIGYLWGPPLLSFAYMISIWLMIRSGKANALLRSLSSVGRLALTNYLSQSIIANIVLMSWGIGLYGKLNAQSGVTIVVGVFAAQVLISHMWLRRFEIGPLEWLWRAISYGSRPRFLRQRQ